jgi:hypothetical protein
MTLTEFYQQNSRRLRHQFGRRVRDIWRVVYFALSSSGPVTGNPIRASRGHKLIRNRSPAKRFGARCRERLRINNWCLRKRLSATTARGPPGPRHLATVAKRGTTRTNTVFIVADTREMAVPVARLSIDWISGQNSQFETHTSGLDLEGAKGILTCCSLPAPERRG